MKKKLPYIECQYVVCGILCLLRYFFPVVVTPFVVLNIAKASS